MRIFWIDSQKLPPVGFFKFVDNPKIIYEYIPGALVDGSIINKQGYKDLDFVAQKPDNEVRIIMLGDSVTSGMYVPIEKTFSKRLERILNQKAAETKSTMRYNIMNFGVNGYNLEACLETLKTRALLYTPDIVVLNLFYNDIEPIPNLWWFFIDEHGLNEQLKSLILQKYFRDNNSFATNLRIQLSLHSRLFQFIAHKIQTLHNKAGTIPLIKDRFQKKGDVFDCGDDRVNDYFREINKLGKQYNFKVLVCIHPFLNYSEHAVNDRLERLVKSSGLACCRIIEYYRKENVPEGSLKTREHPDDICHPGELGHIIIAKALFSELKKYGFIDKNLSDAPSSLATP